MGWKVGEQRPRYDQIFIIERTVSRDFWPRFFHDSNPHGYVIHMQIHTFANSLEFVQILACLHIDTLFLFLSFFLSFFSLFFFIRLAWIIYHRKYGPLVLCLTFKKSKEKIIFIKKDCEIFTKLFNNDITNLFSTKRLKILPRHGTKAKFFHI